MDVTTMNNPVEQPVRMFLAEDISALAADIPAGVGLVFDYSFVTTVPGELATDPCGARCNRIKLVTAAGGDFAGVLAKPVKAEGAMGSSDGIWVYVYKPGSFCPILTAGAVTLGDDLVVSANAASLGLFVAVTAAPNSEKGAGTAKALQTHAVTGALILGKLQEGTLCTLKA